jgi:pyridoxal 5'-phosphate synthase pdxT subunit
VPVGVLALQGDVGEHLAALADLGASSRLVREPADLAGLDGIVLPGGESTTVSMLLESAGLLGPLGKELEAGIPALGTCAGLILLATELVDGRDDQRTFGAIDLIVRRNGYGRQLDSFECDLDVPNLGDEPFPGVFIRAPAVERVGPEVEVLASLRGAPVLCRQDAILVSAFHPELTADRRVHQLFLSFIDHRER